MTTTSSFPLTKSFQIEKTDPHSKARAGKLLTPHGEIETPVFMPVGTQASVKTLDSQDVEDMGYRIILGNTYHLFLRPGKDVLIKAGGLHNFMSWNRGILTDSGGYQVFSLAHRCVLKEEGVTFSSHIDGQRHLLSPEITTDFQLEIGSDIAMCLDDCPPYPSLKSDVDESLERTTRWAARCRDFYLQWLSNRFKPETIHPLLFGIVQGGGFSDLRQKSAKQLSALNFPGYAIGGLGIGEPKDLTWEMVDAVINELPIDKPHYLMGFGRPEDFWLGVERGVDMFDCVLATRNGRNGQAFTFKGRLNLFNRRFRDDFQPIDADCPCPACRRYTRGYICHLFRAGEMLAPRLVTLHNLWFMVVLLGQIRSSLLNGTFREAKQKFFSQYDTGQDD